jgi:urease accessory protein
LSVRAKNGRSRRVRLYEDGALRVRFPNGNDLEAMIVNTAGGMAGGDRFRLDIDVGDNAALTVSTAAAEKVYRSRGDATPNDKRHKIGHPATLRWLPQETIFFDAARLRRSIDIDMAGGARLVVAEAIMFGRTAMGEAVIEGTLFDRWRVRRDGRLVFADTSILDGAIKSKLAARAVANTAVTLATVCISPLTDDQLARIRSQTYAGEVGISAWNGLAIARLLAHNDEALRHDLRLLLQASGETLPRLWLN